jgi:hypothetical protein
MLEGYCWLLARRLAGLGRSRPGEAARRLLRHAVRRRPGSRLQALDAAWRDAALATACRGWTPPGHPPRRFLCDESLGGLARWLWAAGCEASWAKAGGTALVSRALETGAALLTSDARVLERRIVAGGELVALWVPVHRDPPEQLRLVFEELGLRRANPRCMRCGGVLSDVEKAAVAARIPPRTAAWLDAYQVCRGCGGLFWRGTHWQRLSARLPA